MIDDEPSITSSIKYGLEKEGYVVTLYFSEEVKELLLGLLEYRKINNIIDNGYVFVSYTDGKFDKVTNGTLNSWCHIIGEMINVPTLHAHDFRHSGAAAVGAPQPEAAGGSGSSGESAESFSLPHTGKFHHHGQSLHRPGHGRLYV